jgi:hypothetical protein
LKKIVLKLNLRICIKLGTLTTVGAQKADDTARIAGAVVGSFIGAVLVITIALLLRKKCTKR